MVDEIIEVGTMEVVEQPNVETIKELPKENTKKVLPKTEVYKKITHHI